MFNLREKVNNTFVAQKLVMCSSSSPLFFAVFALIFAWLFYSVTVLPGQSFESWSFSASDITKIFITISSVLLSLIATTQVYIYRNFAPTTKAAKSTASGVISLLSGLLSTLCCSPILLTTLGLVGFGALILKYQTELLVVSTILLLFSLYYSSKVIYCEECQVKVGKIKKK